MNKTVSLACGRARGQPIRSRGPAVTHANGESYVDLCLRVSYNSKDQIVKILMIAPEPFFEPRGTPFSEYHRIRALLELGHTVDLVTYPFGRDVSLPGLRVFRCLRPPFVHEGPDRSVAREDPARSHAHGHGPAARARRSVRRRPLARGGKLHRRADRGGARHAAPVRHALEPAAAAHEFRVQPIARAQGRRSRGWSASSSAARGSWS